MAAAEDGEDPNSSHLEQLNMVWLQIVQVMGYMDTEVAEREHILRMISNMLVTLPLTLVGKLSKIDEYDDKRRAFAAFIVCKTLNCQANKSYVNQIPLLLDLQVQLLQTLQVGDALTCQYLLADLAHLYLCLNISLIQLEEAAGKTPTPAKNRPSSRSTATHSVLQMFSPEQLESYSMLPGQKNPRVQAGGVNSGEQTATASQHQTSANTSGPASVKILSDALPEHPCFPSDERYLRISLGDGLQSSPDKANMCVIAACLGKLFCRLIAEDEGECEQVLDPILSLLRYAGCLQLHRGNVQDKITSLNLLGQIHSLSGRHFFQRSAVLPHHEVKRPSLEDEEVGGRIRGTHDSERFKLMCVEVELVTCLLEDLLDILGTENKNAVPKDFEAVLNAVFEYLGNTNQYNLVEIDYKLVCVVLKRKFGHLLKEELFISLTRTHQITFLNIFMGPLLSDRIDDISAQSFCSEEVSIILGLLVRLGQIETMVLLVLQEMRFRQQLGGSQRKRNASNEGGTDADSSEFSINLAEHLKEDPLEVWNKLMELYKSKFTEFMTDGRAKEDTCIRLLGDFLSLCKLLLRKCLNYWVNVTSSCLDICVAKLAVQMLWSVVEAGADLDMYCLLMQLSSDLATLLSPASLWLLSSQSGSSSTHHPTPEAAELQLMLVGLASLPWLSSLGPPADLRLGGHSKILAEMAWSSPLAPSGNPEDYERCQVEAALNDCMRVLSIIGRDIAPKWRRTIFKHVASSSDLTHLVVRHVPFLSDTLEDGCGRGLAAGLISSLNSQLSAGGVKEIAQHAGLLICCQTRCIQMRVDDSVEDDLQLIPICTRCCHIATAHKGVVIPAEGLEPLFKLIGHDDKEVRLSVLSMMKSFCIHSTLANSAASLLLSYLEDSEYYIRKSFSMRVHFLLEGDCPTLKGRDHVTDFIVKRLLELKPSGDRETPDHWETYVSTLVGVIQCEMPQQCELQVLDALLSLFFATESHTNTFMGGLEVLKRYVIKEKIYIFRWFARYMCQAKETGNLLNYLNLFCPNSNTNEYISLNIHHILAPVILSSAKEKITAPLEALGNFVGQRPKSLINDNFSKIYAHLIVESEDQKHLNACKQFLKERTGVTIAALINSNRLSVMEELLSQMNLKRTRILPALGECAMYDAARKDTKKRDLKPEDELTKIYLSDNLMAVLSFFLTKLSNKAVTVKVKLEIIRSLSELIKYLGPEYLNHVKHSLLACLKTSGSLSKGNPAFLSASVSLWEAFVRNISLSSLSVILPQVVVGLTQHLAFDRKTIADLFKYLLVDNKFQFEKILPTLVFLPEVPGRESILDDRTGNKIGFRNLLAKTLIFIDHESVEVRHQVLDTLDGLLAMNMGALQGLLLLSDQVDPIICELIEKLLLGTSNWEPDPELRLLAAQCLGKLGSVDPGRLELNSNPDHHTKTVSHQNFLLDIHSPDFCVKLLQELVRAYQSSREPFILENCMFSIQEILKIYEISGPSQQRSTTRAAVMSALSDSVLEILTPLMTSLYRHSPGQQTAITVPIFGTSQATTYRDWLVNFSTLLMSSVYEGKTGAVLKACLPVVKKDVRTAEFLLPHIVVSVLCGGGEEGINNILAELAAIMSDHNTKEKQSTKQAESCEDNLFQMVAQAVFSILDHLRSWLRAKYLYLVRAAGKVEDSLKIEDYKRITRDREYKIVRAFMDRISDDSLACLSYNTGAFHRAAFHYDRLASLEKEPTILSYLQSIFTFLEEPDIVVGVAAIRRENPNLDDLLLYHRAIGNFQDVISCYERSMELGSVNYRGLIECYMEMDQPAAAALLAAGVVSKNEDLSSQLAPLQAEAAWQLGRWEDLEHFTSLPVEMTPEESTSTSWSLHLSKVMLSAYKRDDKLLVSELQQAREDVLKSLTALSSEQSAYRKGYLYITQLGILHEVQKISQTLLLPSTAAVPITSMKMMDGSTAPGSMAILEALLEELEARLNYTSISWSNLEPIIRVRRSLLKIVMEHYMEPEIKSRVRAEIGSYWLRSAKIARKAGQLQESYGFLLEAEKYNNHQVFLEKAKLSWQRGNHTEAINILKKGLTDSFPDVVQALDCGEAPNKDGPVLSQALKDLDSAGLGQRELCAKGKLLLARYVEDASNVSYEKISKYYDHAKEVIKNSDEIFYHQAKFFDKQCQKMTPEQMINQSEVVVHATLTYLRCVKCGPTFIYECLPRMLTIWLDFAATIQEALAVKTKSRPYALAVENANQQLAKLNKSIYSTRIKIPSYYFLTVFPQIVSRICHQHEYTYSVLKSLIVLVFRDYPQQSFWHMVYVSKNRDEKRKSRCAQVFEEAREQRDNIRAFLDDALVFSCKIDELCDKTTPDRATVTSFSEILPSLPALFKQSNFSNIILPIQRNMGVTCPTSEADPTHHQPFPQGMVYIAGVENSIQVMLSLVKPKKISLRGSDGRVYSFLAKPKDDLRRDCRLMDLANQLNRMFRKEPESRKRDHKIRTYTVVPTNETSGLIEWVHNLKGMRSIISQLLKERGCNPSMLHKGPPDAEKDSLERKKEILLKCIDSQKCGDRSAAVFGEWFVRTFPDPQAWLMARTSFTRTTAVMSVVGYILGLGDRHLENINVDTNTGQVFHVDMNSLFNISETYKVPEIVPFRLTHNMVHGFGPLGIEGPYRISCEVTMRLMRTQQDLLMSILRPFIFDPLVDWTVRDKSKHKRFDDGTGDGEEQNRPGVIAIGRVEDRLKGCVTTDKKRKGNLLNPVLSVEGQVDHIIRDASSIDNLAQMYWGWAPFL